MSTQDPRECEYCFMSGEPPFPTCRINFKDSLDADNTCVLWRCKDYCPLFSPKRRPIIDPSGSIAKLIGRELTWADEPVELKD